MMSTASPAYLAAPEVGHALTILCRAAQDSVGGVIGESVTATLDSRRTVTPDDLHDAAKNVLIELQFERPAEVHHSVVLFAASGELIQMFSLENPVDEAEILGAESLLRLGDIVSTILDTIVGDLTWLQPAPRAWLANLEPIAADPSGGTRIELPPTVGHEAPLYLVELTLTNAGGAACTIGAVYSEQTELALLGLDHEEETSPPESFTAPPEDWVMATGMAQTSPEHGASPPGNLPAADPGIPVQSVQFKPLGSEQAVGKSNSIDLIRDVPLRIAVELGRASLTVREILALGVGSVVELDRLAGEPVDVLVNDRLIGRGEVVIVDESFGVRLTEVFRESSKRSTP